MAAGWVEGGLALYGALTNASNQSSAGSAAQSTLQGSYMAPWTFAGAGGITAGMGVPGSPGVNPFANSNGWTNYNSLAGVGQNPPGAPSSPTGGGAGAGSAPPNFTLPPGGGSPATSGNPNFSVTRGGQATYGPVPPTAPVPLINTGGAPSPGSVYTTNPPASNTPPYTGGTNGSLYGGQINSPFGERFLTVNSGNPALGPGGTGGFNLGPQNNAIMGGYQTLAGQGAGMAGQFLNGLPQGLQNAYGQAQGMAQPGMLPQGTQGGLYGLNGLYGGGLGGSAGMMGMGLQQAQNPLIGMSQAGAANLIGNAGTNFNNIYNSSLANLQQQLQIPQQQQMNAVNNAEFERGQMGTTGGALQTQAMATGFGQADLAAQQQAFNQALQSQQTALTGAGTLGNLATGQQTSGMNMFGAGATGMGNFGSLSANNLQNIYGQNQGLFGTAQNQAQTGLNNAFTYAGMPGQLASQYLGVSGTGAQDMAGLFGLGTNAYQLAENTSANEAAALNKVGLGLSGLLNNNNAFGTTSPWGAVGQGISNAGGLNGIANGISNLFSGNPQSPTPQYGSDTYGFGGGSGAGTNYLDPNAGANNNYISTGGGDASTNLDWLGGGTGT